MLTPELASSTPTWSGQGSREGFMNACNRQLLSAHADRELDPESSARVETHLSECENCRSELGDLRRGVMVVLLEGVAGLTSAESERLHDAIDEEADHHAPIL